MAGREILGHSFNHVTRECGCRLTSPLGEGFFQTGMRQHLRPQHLLELLPDALGLGHALLDGCPIDRRLGRNTAKLDTYRVRHLKFRIQITDQVVNKIISIVNLLFTRLGFNLVNASQTGHTMTFLLETDFTVRRQSGPGETASRSRNTPKEASSGADFARSLAEVDIEAPEGDAPKQLATVSPDLTGAVSILMERQSPADAPALDDTAAMETPLDIKSDTLADSPIPDSPLADGKAGEGAADPILADIDDTDEALATVDPKQTIAMGVAPTPIPAAAATATPAATAIPASTSASTPAAVSLHDGAELAEPSDKVVTNASTAALPQTTLPDKQPQPNTQPQQVNAPEQASETSRQVTAEAAPEKPAADANMTTVGVAQGAAPKATNTAASQSDRTVTTTTTAQTPRTAEATQVAKVKEGEKHRADAPSMEIDSADTAALSAISAEQTSTNKLVATHDKGAPVDAAAMVMTAGTPQPAVTQSAAPIAPPVMNPTNALVSATPAEVVDILSDSLASPDEKKNHVHIQLDPPELGRVSLEFKFDTHGLQHVTIVGETPEAMRQLRLMHFELVNALERQGLSSENMSYQQQQTPQNQGQQAGRDSSTPQRNASGQTSRALPDLVAQNTIQSRPTSSARLNIKL